MIPAVLAGAAALLILGAVALTVRTVRRSA